jgi:opacity protein-like surface antigen
MKKLMFKMSFLVIVISLVASYAFAQDFYVQVNGGYGTNLSSTTLYDHVDVSSVNGYLCTKEAIPLSYGKGFNFGGAVGYMITPHFGAEVGVSYLVGGKTGTTASYSSGSGSAQDYGEITYSSRMVRIVPSVVIASGLPVVDPYARFGMVLGFGSLTTGVTYHESGFDLEATLVDKGGVALGLSSGVGLNVHLTSWLSLFGELDMVNMAYGPTQGEFTQLTMDGEDQLSELTVSEREWEYVNTLTVNWEDPPPDSEPSQELRTMQPFGSFGGKFGIRVNF